MYGLRKDQIGTLATDTEKTVWPKFDIEGNTYDRSVATVKYLRGRGDGKSTLFAVIPPGRTWEPGDVSAKHPDELAAEAAVKSAPVRKADNNAPITD
jgi:hypothetical protein